MTLFSAPDDPWSHRTRIVLAEKGISIDIVSVEPGRFPEDLLDLNPYHSVPTLVDRDLVLYDSRVIIEYLDERFPHPPLMPVDPVTRAQFRLALYRIERDWYGLAQQIDQEPDKKQTVKTASKILRDTILQSTDLFKVKPFFLSDEFSLVDATIAPILWRLPHYEIDLPPQAQPIEKYAQTGVRAPGVPRGAVRARAGDAALLSSRCPKPLPKRPYLLRAMHQWITECGHTPHVIVDAGRERRRGAARLRQGRQDRAQPERGRDAAAAARQRRDRVRCALRRRRRTTCEFPVSAVLGIYARETGEGMVFSEQDLGPPPAHAAAAEEGGPRRPQLKVVK